MSEINEEKPVLEWDFWDEVGLHCAGYSSQIDEDLIKVFLGIRRGWNTREIAQHFTLDGRYVELLQYAFCSIGWADYGTSPRGCYIDPDHDAEELQMKLLKWFVANWSEEDAKELRASVAALSREVTR
jgi:hypothetical protein